MGLSQKMFLKQGQSLVMTPQLQQAIKLLGMSNTELQSFIESEIERNPLLEREDRGQDRKTQAEDSGEPRALEKNLGQSGEISDAPEGGSEMADDSSRSPDMAGATPGLKDSGWSSMRSSGSGSFDGDMQDAAALITREETLIEHLNRQLNVHLTDPADQIIGQYLIGMINDAGYLTADLASVAEQYGCGLAQVERVLGVMQSFEPAGVCARDLAECLALQLKERNRFDPAMEALIAHLPLVAKRDFQQLRSICKVSQDDVLDMIAELKTLNPKPGNAYGYEPVAPVIPDVYVRPAPDGSWFVELNADSLPRVLMNNHYAGVVSKGAKSQEDKVFLSEAQAQANWLIKSLDQRARTILKVAKDIVAQQDAFLVHGIQHLRPLNLRMVAENVGMHESTISRVTSNKYMATPRGVFELKYFFTNAITSTEDGEGHSSEAVRHRIRELIAKEPPDAVLADDTLVEILAKEGIEIARRTVAKYRESLNIPSSVQRRREARAKR
jgi:RNA polymerase sigma-54 factor